MPHPKKYAIVPPGKEWRERLATFKVAYTNRSLDSIHQDIEDKVYAMALDGSQLSTIIGRTPGLVVCASACWKGVPRCWRCLEAILFQKHHPGMSEACCTTTISLTLPHSGRLGSGGDES